MRSHSKINLSQTQLEQLSLRFLGGPLASSREVPDGWFNTIHLLETQQGRRAALKVAPRAGFVGLRYETELLGAEVGVLRLLADRGIPVPRVLAQSVDGEVLGLPWFLMEWVDGEPLSKVRPEGAGSLDRIDEEVGFQTARVHRIVGTRFGRWNPDRTASRSWAESFSAMVDDLLADALDRNVDLRVAPDVLRSLVAGARGDLDQVTEPRLVLWDLHDGNVLVRRGPPALAAFLDPDRALWGDPLMEFGFRPLAASSTAWHRGYQNGREHPDPQAAPGARRRRALYDLYLALVMVIEVAYRGFEPDHEAWARGQLTQALIGCGVAPQPDRGRACVAVFNQDRTAILMVFHRTEEGNYWTLPGGGIEAGESPEAAAVREVREETGLEVRLLAPLFEESYLQDGEPARSLCFWGERVGEAPLTLGNDPEEACLSPDLRMLGAVAWRPLAEVRTDRQVSRVLERIDRLGGAWIDPALEDEVDGLLGRLSLVQKVSFLSGRDFWRTAAVPSLGLSGVTMTDGPHGVRIGNELKDGKTPGTATAFPTGVALASTWDRTLLRRVGQTLAAEARAAGCDVLLGPCVNLVRTPVAGRNFETFAEDPFLAGKLGASYVQGLQSRGIGASVKHFACNNQEFERTRGSSEVSDRALRELYLAQFEIIVKESDPWTLMCSYNRINGTHASQHRWLLTQVLKDEWGYPGVVVSDWNANHEVYESVRAGLDLEMPGPPVYFGKLLEAAVKSWQIDEGTIDGAVRRLLRLEKRVQAYQASHPEDGGAFSGKAHTDLAREVSAASMVLLKNDGGVLPIPRGTVRRLAVIGPTAAVASYGGGGSSVVPCVSTVSPLQGLTEAYGDGAEVVYAPGCADRVKADSLGRVGLVASHQGMPGFCQETWTNRNHSGSPLLVERSEELDFWQIFLHDDRIDPRAFSMRWTANLVPARSGRYRFKLSYQGLFRLFLDGDPIDQDQDWHDRPPYPFYAVRKTEPVTLEAGRSYELRVELVNTLESDRNALILKAQYLMPEDEVQAAIDEALALVRSADRTVLVVGHAAGFEQEGIDRDDLLLPGAQNRLIEAVVAADPQAVVVLNTGAPVEMPWVSRVSGLIQAHFFGQEGGRALADLVTGDTNPSGRLTVSYPQRYEDNPAFPYYPGGRQAVYGEGVFVGYRHYDAYGLPVLFPFGHGLSYSQFRYSDLTVTGSLEDGTLRAAVKVANLGLRDGAEVVQLYIGDCLSSEPRPPRELKGFDKVFLRAGEAAEVTFALDRRSFSFWGEQEGRWVLEPGDFDLWVGASSRDPRARASVTLGVPAVS